MIPYCPKCGGIELKRSKIPKADYLNSDNGFSTIEYWKCLECRKTFIASVEYRAYLIDWEIRES